MKEETGKSKVRPLKRLMFPILGIIFLVFLIFSALFYYYEKKHLSERHEIQSSSVKQLFKEILSRESESLALIADFLAAGDSFKNAL